MHRPIHSKVGIGIIVLIAIIAIIVVTNQVGSTSWEPQMIKKVSWLGKRAVTNSGQSENGEFTFSKCDHSLNDETYPNKVKSIQWDGETLAVTNILNLNCAMPGMTGSHNVDNDKLVLNVVIAENKGGFMASCTCNYETKFQIKDVQKKDYQVVFQINGKEVDSFHFDKNDKISDACDNDISEKCYNQLIFPQRKQEKDVPGVALDKEITYDTEEEQNIARKYSEFEDYLWQEILYQNESALYDFKKFNISYDNATGELKFKLYDPKPTTLTLTLGSGSDFETAVLNYVKIAKDKKRYLLPEFKKTPNLEGVDILYVHPNSGGFSFLYKGYKIDYFQGSSMRFLDKAPIIEARFKNGTESKIAKDITAQDLFDLVDKLDLIYTSIASDDKIKLSAGGWTYVDVDLSQGTASFSIENSYDGQQYRTRTIHNRTLKLEYYPESRLEMDIQTGKIRKKLLNVF